MINNNENKSVGRMAKIFAFYDMVKLKGKTDYKEIISELKISNAAFFRLAKQLEKIGKIKRLGGGFYCTAEWDNDMEKLVGWFDTNISPTLKAKWDDKIVFPSGLFGKICASCGLNFQNEDLRRRFKEHIETRGYIWYETPIKPFSQLKTP